MLDKRNDAATSAPHQSGQANEGDFRTQIVAYLPRLRAFARVLTRNADQADDLVHDTLLRALRAEATYQMGTNINAWLLTILRNQHISNLRRRRFEAAPIDDLPDAALATPAGQIPAMEILELREALAKMSAEHRETLLLVGAAGLSYEEAASVCKCAVGTVKSRVNRARTELRRLMSSSSSAAVSDADVARAAY